MRIWLTSDFVTTVDCQLKFINAPLFFVCDCLCEEREFYFSIIIGYIFVTLIPRFRMGLGKGEIQTFQANRNFNTLSIRKFPQPNVHLTQYRWLYFLRQWNECFKFPNIFVRWHFFPSLAFTNFLSNFSSFKFSFDIGLYYCIHIYKITHHNSIQTGGHFPIGRFLYSENFNQKIRIIAFAEHQEKKILKSRIPQNHSVIWIRIRIRIRIRFIHLSYLYQYLLFYSFRWRRRWWVDGRWWDAMLSDKGEAA